MANTNACSSPSKRVKKQTMSKFKPLKIPKNSKITDPCIAVKYNFVIIEPPKMFPNKRKEIDMIDDIFPIILSGNMIKNGLKKFFM